MDEAAKGVIDFVRRADNLSFRDALEGLSNGQPQQPSNQSRPNPLSLDDRTILTTATAVSAASSSASPATAASTTSPPRHAAPLPALRLRRLTR